ncbi:hypothetical protein CYMTET_32966 [Cymbomonas tetramitiformis]|uniref:Reverse transcriptase Ty1/copia-type domain-containing protein n=1 Tax=Cymbomonas tetramitiformis TaxID=36881 RepID=A0AAE0FE19_9CHLO|nr:hypothetical protein CYMTET_32966 [Cymbomonas tetramitiformis]
MVKGSKSYSQAATPPPPGGAPEYEEKPGESSLRDVALSSQQEQISALTDMVKGLSHMTKGLSADSYFSGKETDQEGIWDEWLARIKPSLRHPSLALLLSESTPLHMVRGDELYLEEANQVFYDFLCRVTTGTANAVVRSYEQHSDGHGAWLELSKLRRNTSVVYFITQVDKLLSLPNQLSRLAPPLPTFLESKETLRRIREYSANARVTPSGKPLCMETVETIFSAMAIVRMHPDYMLLKAKFMSETLPIASVLSDQVTSHYDTILAPRAAVAQTAHALDTQFEAAGAIADDRRKQEEAKRKILAVKVPCPVCHRRGLSAKDCFIKNVEKREAFFKKASPTTKAAILKRVADYEKNGSLPKPGEHLGAAAGQSELHPGLEEAGEVLFAIREASTSDLHPGLSETVRPCASPGYVVGALYLWSPSPLCSRYSITILADVGEPELVISHTTGGYTGDNEGTVSAPRVELSSVGCPPRRTRKKRHCYVPNKHSPVLSRRHRTKVVPIYDSWVYIDVLTAFFPDKARLKRTQAQWDYGRDQHLGDTFQISPRQLWFKPGLQRWHSVMMAGSVEIFLRAHHILDRGTTLPRGVEHTVSAGMILYQLNVIRQATDDMDILLKLESVMVVEDFGSMLSLGEGWGTDAWPEYSDYGSDDDDPLPDLEDASDSDEEEEDMHLGQPVASDSGFVDMLGSPNYDRLLADRDSWSYHPMGDSCMPDLLSVSGQAGSGSDCMVPDLASGSDSDSDGDDSLPDLEDASDSDEEEEGVYHGHSDEEEEYMSLGQPVEGVGYSPSDDWASGLLSPPRKTRLCSVGLLPSDYYEDNCEGYYDDACDDLVEEMDLGYDPSGECAWVPCDAWASDVGCASDAGHAQVACGASAGGSGTQSAVDKSAVIDSGATKHIFNSVRVFNADYDTTACETFSVVQSQSVDSSGSGSVTFAKKDVKSGRMVGLQLLGTHCIPGQPFNLLSVVALEDAGFRVDFGARTVSKGGVVFSFARVGNEYIMHEDTYSTLDTHLACAVKHTDDQRDRSDWKFEDTKPHFTTHGPFLLELFSSDDNHILDHYYTITDSCFGKDWAGQQCYGNPPFDHDIILQCLQKALTDFDRDPSNTKFMFILPKWVTASWWSLVSRFDVIHEYPVGAKISSAPRESCYNVANLEPSGEDRVWIEDIKWPVVVLYKDSHTTEQLDIKLLKHAAGTPTVQESLLPAGVTEPRCHSQVLTAPKCIEWLNSIQDELEALVQIKGALQMMDEEDIPAGVKLLEMSLVLKVKLDKNRQLLKRKSRICVRGNKQEYGVDYYDTFAPCTQLSSVRIVITLALNLGLMVYHMDVDTTFLNSVLEEDLYVRLPRGLVYGGHRCAKLLKAVYGLKQAGKEWFDTSDAFIMGYDSRMQRSDVEPCLYFIRDTTLQVIILAYVDDYLVATNDKSWYDTFVASFHAQYACKDLGVLDLVMGIGVRWGSDTAYLSQSGYISQIISTYGLDDAKPASLPMSPGLRWLLLMVRDLCLTELFWGSCSGWLAAAGSTSWYCALLQCLGGGGTGPSRPLSLSIYTDSDYAGCKVTRRSTSGIAVFLCGSLIIFSSMIQKSVSLSTTEAEIIAMSEGAREVKYVLNVLDSLVDIYRPVPMYCDNQGAIHLATNYVNNSRSKHIEVRNMYIRELIKAKDTQALYTGTDDNTSDIMTKPLALPIFRVHRERLGVMNLPREDQ